MAQEKPPSSTPSPGFILPPAVKCHFDGKDLAGLSPFDITALGIARTFQNIRLFANMTAIENVLVGEHCRLTSNLFGQILHTSGHDERRSRSTRPRAWTCSNMSGFAAVMQK